MSQKTGTSTVSAGGREARLDRKNALSCSKTRWTATAHLYSPSRGYGTLPPCITFKLGLRYCAREKWRGCTLGASSSAVETPHHQPKQLDKEWEGNT
jgi:hypothetical protein